MRIPRTNFSFSGLGQNSYNFADSSAEPKPEAPGLRRMKEIASESESWEARFFLAPNVRFTRTPERDLIGPPTREVANQARAAAAARQAAEEQPDPTPSVEQLREILSTMMILEGGSGPSSPVSPPAINDNAEEAKPVAPAAPVAPVAPMVAATPVVPQAPVVSARPAVLVQPSVTVARPAEPVAEAAQANAADNVAEVAQVFAPLSDFAFFESMAFVPDAIELPPAPAIETKPVEPPQQMDAHGQPVTSLYRAVECQVVRRRAMDLMETTALVAPAARIVLPAGISVGFWAPEEITCIYDLAASGLPLPQMVPVAETAPAAQAVETPVVAAVEAPKVEPTVIPASIATAPAGVTLPSPGWMNAERKARTLKGEFVFPSRSLLQDPPERSGFVMTQEQLERNAGMLESVLEDFGIRGEIIHVRPGPVVTLYEFEPAPGVKSSRVIGLADDIARSMSALSARVAVVPGRNVIGIELPNATRETVYLSELIDSTDFVRSGYKLPLCLGKNIGGEPVIAELAKMPHLLVAGTTGSGKSVAINTMILSLLYKMTPEECRLIMVDPKMLELSVYDGIPHLLTPVVTDPKKAVLALKWAVREMEERYKKMSRLGVRNIDGYNARAAQAREKGEIVTQVVQTGFDKGTGEVINETIEMDLSPMPYIVVIVDEMADLMMVAGKEIEGAIQRLAQMARAAGIHLIMATQRPSVDVITGTIKANFPTRISFQVTSKIDSRTILGEQGAEQLLGQGDMLHMAGGGRISRVHGPFVSDEEVEKVVAHLKTQGRPEYLETVTTDEIEEEAEDDGAVFDKTDMGSEDGDDLYEKAVKVVMRDRKCSTSYIQRRLGIGYNRAASLVERMEKEGLVGAANHVGKREIIANRGAED